LAIKWQFDDKCFPTQLAVSLVVFVACEEEEEDPLTKYMYCLFVETPCTEEQVAQLQMQMAALLATIDEEEAMGLGGFPDLQVHITAQITNNVRLN
jgi:hypothetical protein